MRSLIGLGASALAGLAAVVASLDGDAGIVPFFVGLTFLGGVDAWAAHPPLVGKRRAVARGVALVWLLAAIWVGVLLVWYVSSEVVGPPPQTEDTYLGLTATVYHLFGLYGGALAVAVSAFGPERWFDARRRRGRVTRAA